MTQPSQVAEMRGMTLVDNEGQRIGKIDELYVDKDNGQLEWALVHTGLFGLKKSFVPLRGASKRSRDVVVPVAKGQVKDAPRIAADEQLSDDEERRLFEHYGMGGGSAPTAGTAQTGRSEHRDDAMTRSEEQLQVGTENRERGRARLHKYVVTEHEQHTVPVRHEEVRVEREPITEANRGRAMHGPDIRESEHEVVLHEEVPTVDKAVIPKERVRMSTETRLDDQTVSGDVRKERIEAEGEGLHRADR